MMNRKQLFIKLWLLTALASAGAFAFFNPTIAGSFSLGCAAMIINFYGLFSILQNIFESEIAKASAYIGLLMLKFLILAVVIYVLVRYVHVDLLAFGLGFFLIAISATCVTGTMQNHSKEQ